MKRYNNLYDSITFKDFIDVYKDIRSNTKNKLIIKVRKSTLKRYNHKLKLIKNGFIKKEKAILIINSYNALFKYSNYCLKNS